jgi:Domain of unknown function (DUF3806)
VCWLYQGLEDVPDDRAKRVVQFETVLGREKFTKNGWENLPQLGVSTESGEMSQLGEELSAQMRSDAETCERLASRNGFRLDGRLDSLAHLEELIDSLTPWSQATEDLRQAMVRVIGAYFGELIRNTLGGSWVSDEEYRTPAIQVAKSLRIFPHSRVRKRWEEGKERSLSTFVDVLTTRLTSGPM